MPDYRDAIKTVLKHEGGFSDHPADRGGITMYGITRKVYEAYLGKPFASDDEARKVMKAMPLTHAQAIYKKNYWDAIKGDQITKYSKGSFIFGQAVNAGPTAAIKRTQKVLKELNPLGFNKISIDGIMGKTTIDALNSVDEKTFVVKFHQATQDAYNAMVKKNPSQAVFLTGWFKRTESELKDALSRLGQNTIVVNAGIGILVLLGIMGAVFTFRIIKNMKNQPSMVARIAS